MARAEGGAALGRLGIAVPGAGVGEVVVGRAASVDAVGRLAPGAWDADAGVWVRVVAADGGAATGAGVVARVVVDAAAGGALFRSRVRSLPARGGEAA